MQHLQKETIQAALALILGPETDDKIRARAVQRLLKQKESILPIFLTTMSSYPEILTPAWPWWPVQYSHTSRLLLHFCQQEGISLEGILQHDALESPAGPLLWISLMEAAGRAPEEDHEALLCLGLQSQWTSVRYAAATSLTCRASCTPLHVETLQALQKVQKNEQTLQVRLAATHTLFLCGDPDALATILQLTSTSMPTTIRKAATFLLSTEIAPVITGAEREHLILYCIQLLDDKDEEILQQAAHALTIMARPSTLPRFYNLLETTDERKIITVLTILEEVAHNQNMRQILRQQALPTRLLPLVHSANQSLRRQVCYTLATCGGEYVVAVLGTIIANPSHPGYLEALESLRVFYGAYRAPLRDHIVRWLLQALHQTREEIHLLYALDTLIYLLWYTRTNRRKKAWKEISQAVIQDGIVRELLDEGRSRIRRRAIEILIVLGHYLNQAQELHPLLLKTLQTDPDEDMRACVAHTLGQTEARWAIPDLLQALQDPEKVVSHTALAALGHIATPDDIIIVSVIAELASITTTAEDPLHHLVLDAASLLKKWQRIKRVMNQKQLRDPD